MVHLWALYFGLGVAITPTLQEDIDTQILSLYHGKFNGDVSMICIKHKCDVFYET